MRFHSMLYNRYFRGFRSFTKETPMAVEKCLKKARQLKTVDEGDYYEFGLYKGYAFWYAQNTAQKLKLTNMRFFGFDSFKGLPKIVGIDKTKNGFYKGQFTYSKQKVEQHLNSHGVDWSKTFIMDGFFEETLNPSTKKDYDMNKVSVALIDCDLYHSSVKVLDFLKDMLIDNSILTFDDWNCFDDEKKGERLAFNEFLAKNKEIKATEFFSYHKEKYGKAFIINKKR